MILGVQRYGNHTLCDVNVLVYYTRSEVHSIYVCISDASHSIQDVIANGVVKILVLFEIRDRWSDGRGGCRAGRREPGIYFMCK